MRSISVFHQLQSDPKLIQFVRQHPIWYRYLMRDPTKVELLKKEAQRHYGKTLSQRIEKVGHQMKMIDMLIQLTGAMRD